LLLQVFAKYGQGLPLVDILIEKFIRTVFLLGKQGLILLQLVVTMIILAKFEPGAELVFANRFFITGL
jgi:hypothetical protein